MSSLTLVVALQVTILGADGESYKDARAEAEKSGRPLVVMVGAEWCPACVQMKQNVLPDIKKRGILSKVEFAMVDCDEQRSLAQQLIGGGSIPQLLMFRKTRDGSMRSRLIGAQSLDRVKEFVDKGLQRNKAEAKTAAKREPAEGTRAQLTKLADRQPG